MALPTLATPAELSAYLQREVPADAAGIALRLASGKVRGFINRPGLPALVDDTTCPDDVRAVVLAVASRVFGNPNDFRQETVGSESLTYASETIGVQLTFAELRDLKRYRVRYRMLEVGPEAVI